MLILINAGAGCAESRTRIAAATNRAGWRRRMPCHRRELVENAIAEAVGCAAMNGRGVPFTRSSVLSFKVLPRHHSFGSTPHMNFDHRGSRRTWIARIASCIVCVSPWTDVLHAQQLPPDEAALLVLNAGRRAFNEQKYPVAADRFREFLKVAPNHKDAPAARYGLGLVLMETGDAKGALENLTQAGAVES